MELFANVFVFLSFFFALFLKSFDSPAGDDLRRRERERESGGNHFVF